MKCFLSLVFGLLSFVACAADEAMILRTVNDRLAREFISHDGLLLDYVGDIPTPEEIADLKPNAMGWWCPIENGSMFTGEWLPALMAEGPSRKELVERCMRGLIRMSEVSDVPGFIARGTGTDGKSHHPCGSNDQTDPWFLGLCEYCRWPHADPALKAKALERLVSVAKALEANAWGVPCDGPFKGQNRGNLNAKSMPFWGKTRLLYSLKSLERLTGDGHWKKVYGEIKASALDEIEAGGEVDAKVFKPCYGGCVWIYLSSAQALRRLIEMEENPADRARMKKGLLRYAERVAPLMKDRAKYANTTERPFKYANWRTGYAWRVQKTQKEAEAVAFSGKREILGTRKDYERNGMANPLAAAAICALTGDVKFRDEILATLRHYDYSTPNVSEFFHAAIAAAALPPGGGEEVAHEAEVYGKAFERIVAHVRLWPDLAPGETNACRGRFAFDTRVKAWRRHDVTAPELVILKPRTVKHDTMVVLMPGGGYNSNHMGMIGANALPILESGRWVAVLHYRIPRREGRPIYAAPREDAARAIRWLRGHAADYGFSPEKIGSLGFSAGGHLSAISATSSQDKLYDRVDELDDLSAHLNFAVAVYPAYVLDDGATGPNAKRGDGAALLPEFKFDAKTPPMLLLHGDDDYYSSMGSVKLYEELHRRKMPAQLVVYSNASHGLNHNANVRGWESRILDWLLSRNF